MDGNLIAVMRKKKGINQEELAQRLGINTATLSRWENGHFEPKASTIKKICEILSCTETELLNGTDIQTWELRLVISKGKEFERGTINMTGTTSNATLSVADNAMAITISAGYQLWEDDEQFELLVEDLRRKRQLGLKTRKEGW